MIRINIYLLTTVVIFLTVFSCGERSKTKDPGLEYAPNMYEAIAPNYMGKTSVFADGKVAQQPPHGSVPIGHTAFDYKNTLEDYKLAGEELKNPLSATELNLAEGKSLFLSMCSHCHGNNGKGDGSIVKLGKFPAPPSFINGVSSRGGELKNITDGKIYHTIFHGLNLMGSHASQLTPKERWQIVMYINKLK